MKLIFLGAANPETGRMIKAVERTQPQLEIGGFLDNDPQKKGTQFLGYPVLGGFEVLGQLDLEECRFVNLITGDTRTRYETSLHLARAGCQFTNFIHPSVDLMMTDIGTGNYLQESVILQAGVRLGNNNSIHMGSLIGHETKIGSSVFIAHGCSVSGCVTIEDGVFVGTNSTIIPRLRIGRWSTIGAGAAVIKDVPPYSTVVGNPGRVVKSSEEKYITGDIFEN